MKQLFTLIGEQAIDVVLIEYPARLVRFGFGYVEQAFGWKCVSRQNTRSTRKNWFRTC